MVNVKYYQDQENATLWNCQNNLLREWRDIDNITDNKN